jgi:ABC-type multidrug transport system fused ATPase/permease subunit
VAAARLYEILDASERIEERENPLNISALERDIVLEKVSFSYDDNGKKELVLDEVSLKINKGETIAIVGASGAGKSTLLDLIPRFHDSEKGNVLIDGIDIKDLHINQLRAIIGIVSQNSILFNDTIYGNISFGKTYSMDEVVEAAKLANAHDFISKLPKGYYTNIGDRGLNLSGGERQRICIARAIIKNPSILLLDEATSALDTQSEKLVQISLENLMRGRTTLVIAHRLSTIINSDKIIVMDKGRIIEVGNHNELIQKQGVYSNLVKLQTL